MNIKSICNDQDLQIALERIEILWFKEDEDSRDELEILSLLVSNYEKLTISSIYSKGENIK